MSQKFKSEVELQALNNATTDTDKFLVSDSGTIKYRTGSQLLSDLGVSGIYVPYTGATGNVDLGTHTLLAHDLVINHSSGSGVAASITKGGNGEALTINKTSGSGNAMSVTGGLTSLVDLTLSSIPNATIDTDKFIVSDGGAIKYRTGAEVLSDIGGQAALTNPVTGTGTLNFVSKFTSTGSTLGDSQIFDNGSGVGIGTSSPQAKLDVRGELFFPNISTTDGTNVISFSEGTDKAFSIKAYLSGFGATGNKMGIGSDIVGWASNIITWQGNGDVGIGTTSPGGKLHVVGSGIFDDGVNGRITLNSISGTNRISSTTTGFAAYEDLQFRADNYIFSNGNTERMRIDSNGNVGIGTSSPVTRLNVQQSNDVYTTGIGIRASSGTATRLYLGVDHSTLTARVTTDNHDLLLEAQSARNLLFNTNSGERMRITSTGNVGIGTSSPPSKVSISGGTLSVSGSGSGYGVVKLGDPTDVNPYVGMYRSAAASIATSGNFLNLGGYDGIAFTTGAAQLSGQPERMRITSSGFVGIGTTAPTYRLQVSDTIASVTAFGNFAALQSIGGTGYRWSLNNDSTFRLQYTTNGFSTITTPLFVTSNGALGVGVTPTNTAGRLEAANDIVAFSSSDKRWKTNIKNIDSPLEKISQINGVEFDWIEDEPVHGNKGHDIGVIAQEIEKILPDAVQTRESGMKAVKYEKVIPLLIEAVKEQQKQIEELKQLLNGITN